MSGLPNPVLQDQLRTLDGTWLEVKCCGGKVFLPIRLLAMEHGEHRRLGDIVARLRCKQCGGRPVEVALTEDAHGGWPGHGGAPGWRLPLP